MVKKCNLIKIFKQNRHCLLTIFIAFVVIFGYSFDSFAQSYQYWGNLPAVGGSATYESGGTVVDVYDLTENNGYYPTLSSNDMQSYYGGSGTLNIGTNNANGFPQSASNFDRNGLFTSATDYCFFVPVGGNTGNFEYSQALNQGYYLGSFNTNTYSQIYNWRFNSAGDVALVKYGTSFVVLSNQPLYYIEIISDGSYSAPTGMWIGLDDEADEHGFYSYSFGNYTTHVFTDMPIYISSSDGSTGYTSAEDFSFETDNTNFNNLIVQGTIPDPSAPQESEIEKVSKSYMNFSSTDSWTGDALTQMYHNINFNPNEYMKLHGERFQIVIETSATYKGSDMQQAVSFTMPEETIKVDMLMAQSPRGTIVVPVDLHNMKDGNGTDIRQYILNTLHTATGTSEEYININILGNIGQGIQDVVNSTTGLSFTPFTQTKVIVRNDYAGFVDEFKLMSKIFVRSAPPDYNYESDFNSTQYDLVSGNYDILQNGGANNLYPPSENPDSGGTPSVIPNTPTSNGSEVTVNSGGISNVIKDLVGSVQAIIEKGAVQNTVSPQQTAYGGSIESGAVVVQTGGGGFQMSQQQWNQFGGLINEMRNDLTTLESDNGVLSCMQAVQNVTEGILPEGQGGTPNKMWYLIYAGVAGSIAIALWNKAAHNH